MHKIIFSLIGTLGFCVILNMPKKRIPFSLIGALISAGIYELLKDKMELFICVTIASFSIGIYSEIMARIVKTPSTVILLPSTIPLLPGAALYYAMNNFVNSNYSQFISFLLETIYTGFGIAVGAILTYIFKVMLKKYLK